jgi:hypothetical protein
MNTPGHSVGDLWCYGGVGSCEAAPDSRHKWIKIGDGGDSNELFECEYCHQRIWD